MIATLEHTDDELAEEDRLTHLFFVLCILLVSAAATWAYFGRLDVVSTAVGEVIPSTQVKSVQHLEGGIVREIMVREGDQVKQGQPLINLEPISNDADVEELRSRLSALSADIARLNAEAEGLSSVTFAKEIIEHHGNLVQETTAYFTTRQRRLNNQLDGQKEKITETKEQIQEITIRIQNARKQLKLLGEQVEISNNLMKDQLTNRMLHLDLLKDVATFRGNISEDQAALRKAQAAHKGAEKRLETIRDSFVEKAREELETKRRSHEEFSSRVRKFEDSLRRTVLRSPVDGVIKTLHVVTVGGVVAPGGTVVDVVPAGDRMIIEAKLPPQDIGYVHAGQSALVTLASSDANRFGNLDGEVVHVSPDTIESADGQVFYKVRIATEKDHFQRQDSKYRLVPGVQVTTSIRTGERSVLAYITDPFMSSARLAMRER
jgi:membrane fusion protein, adhesin transport system